MRFATFEAIAAAHPRSAWPDWPQALRQPDGGGGRGFRAQPRGRRALRTLSAMACRPATWRQRRLHRGPAVSSFGFCRDLAVGAARDGAESWSTQHVARARCFDRRAAGSLCGGRTELEPSAADSAGAVRRRLRGFRALIARQHAARRLAADRSRDGPGAPFLDSRRRAGERTARMFAIRSRICSACSRWKACARAAPSLAKTWARCPKACASGSPTSDVLSYQPLWFQKDGATFHAPSRYAAKAVACVSTHDLPTFAGWWNGADIAERHALRILDDNAARRARARPRWRKGSARRRGPCGRTRGLRTGRPRRRAHDAAVTRDIHRFVGAAPAMLVLLQADDLAAETVAQNLPGTDRERPNWRRKIGIPAARTLGYRQRSGGKPGLCGFARPRRR